MRVPWKSDIRPRRPAVERPRWRWPWPGCTAAGLLDVFLVPRPLSLARPQVPRPAVVSLFHVSRYIPYVPVLYLLRVLRAPSRLFGRCALHMPRGSGPDMDQSGAGRDPSKSARASTSGAKPRMRRDVPVRSALPPSSIPRAAPHRTMTRIDQSKKERSRPRGGHESSLQIGSCTVQCYITLAPDSAFGQGQGRRLWPIATGARIRIRSYRLESRKTSGT